MKLVMAMKVRDEADVIEQNLRYHHAQGADQFIVTDNGSTDGTTDVLRSYRDAGLLRLIEEPGEDFREQAHGWVTRMARLAATEMDADWVAHVDADEFWWPIGGSLKQVLDEIPDRFGVVLAPRPEFVARADGEGSFLDRLTARETKSRLRPKIAHRAHPDATLHRGAHDIDVERTDGTRHAGRAVMRAVKPERFAEDRELVWAPTFPARVLHFPIRSFEQYKRRVETTIFHGGFSDKAHDDLRERYEAGKLGELYAELVVDEDDVESEIATGRLVRDQGLRDFLEECPDPLAGPTAGRRADGPAGAERAQAAERAEKTNGARQDDSALQAEREAIELDAMASLARTQRSLIRQLDTHRTRLKRQRRRLRRLRRNQGGALRRMSARVRRKSR